MKSSKRQSLIVIGFGLIILSGVILYFALSMPRISISSTTSPAQLSQGTSYSDTENSVYSSYAYNTQSSYSAGSYNNDSGNYENTASYPVNLNTCTAQELMTIDGIGEKKASDIIEYREYLGGYTSVEQIKNIKGIGEGVFDKVSPYLTV